MKNLKINIMYRSIAKFSMSGLLALTLSAGAAAEGGFSLSGTIKGLPDSARVVLVDVEDPNENFEELAVGPVSGGVFELKGSVKGPRMCSLRFQRPDRKMEAGYRTSFSVPLIVENCEINVASTVPYDTLVSRRRKRGELTVTGGEAQRQYDEYARYVAGPRRKAEKIGHLGAKKYFDSNADEDTVAKYDALLKIAENEYQDARLNFIKEHPDYHISSIITQQELVKQFVYTADEINAMAEMVKLCPDTARVSLTDRYRRFALRYALNRAYPDFEATDPDGKVTALSSLVTPGKFAFVDFWASWCGPCRSAIPHVRELYKKYGDRLQVLSVSVDNSEKAWRKAMDEEKMEWRQLHLAGGQSEVASKAYFLTAIPRLILIDDKGRIVCSTNKPAEVTEMLEAKLGK